MSSAGHLPAEYRPVPGIVPAKITSGVLTCAGTAAGTAIATVAVMTEWAELEYATVGALLLAPAELRQVSGWLRPEDFSHPLCGEVYALIVRMNGDGTPVDPVTVRDELRKAGRVRRDGWPTMELVRMVESVPTPLSVGYYGRLVVETALYRRVEQAGTRLVQAGRSRRGEVDDVFGLIRDECNDLLALRRRHAESAAPVSGAGPVALRSLVRDARLVDGRASQVQR